MGKESRLLFVGNNLSFDLDNGVEVNSENNLQYSQWLADSRNYENENLTEIVSLLKGVTWLKKHFVASENFLQLFKL